MERHPSSLHFSWQDAMEYCAWVGKHVPSSAQWEYAARHDPRTP
jgi:formylglycine-generating enzyme required for sulfatase activity